MEYQTIDGEKVPSLGLGTWRMSGRQCEGAVEKALGMGYRHIDTARMYGNEAEVGRAIRNSGVDRGEVFLTTKLWTDDFTAERVPRATEDSLRELSTEYVDLLLMHWPSQSVPLGETLGAMRELQEEGKVRHVGVSNFSPALVREAAEHVAVFCNQVEYHPQKPQDELLEQAREMDYLLTAYSPVAKGRLLDDATLQEVAGSRGKTVAQVALRWLVQKDRVAAIPKASSEEHLRSNLDVFDFTLTDDELQRISRAAGP